MTFRKVLFVCSGNIDRSPTAEAMLKGQHELEVRSAGTLPMAPTRLTKELIDWADVIFAMEEEHRQTVLFISPQAEGKVVVLNIPDLYSRNDPRLRSALRKALSKYMQL